MAPMKLQLRKSVFVFILLCADQTACGTPANKTAPSDKPVAAKTETEEENPLGKVINLSAVQEGNAILLAWNAVEQAEEYQIHRQSRAWPAPGLHRAAPGEYLGRTKTFAFTDDLASPNTEYTYWVFAINKNGEGPLSAPVTIVFKKYPGWLRADSDLGPDDYVDPWDSGFPATPGGNAGLTQTTPLPYSPSEFTACSSSAFALTQVRPALFSVLGEQPQTFSATITYSTSTPDPTYPTSRYFVRAYTYATHSGEWMPLYEEAGYMLNGCNQVDVSFTANPEDLLDVVSVSYGREWRFNEWDWWSAQAQYFTYIREAGSWIRLVNTTPTWGSELTTGTVSATLAFNNMESSPIGIALIDNDSYKTYASFTTVVAGSGTFMVDLPYESSCGSNDIELLVDSEVPWFLNHRVPYTMSTTQAFSFDLENKAIWIAPSQAGGTVGFQARGCNGSYSPVTISTDPGLKIGYIQSCSSEAFRTRDHDSCYVTAQVVNSSTSNYKTYYLHLDEAYLSNQGYGSFVSNITVKFGAVTITRPVDIHILDYFWKTPPPTVSQNAQAYLIEVTAVNSEVPFVDLRMRYTGISYEYETARLWWNESSNSYAGIVTYSACGSYENTLRDSRGYYSYWWSGLFAATDVQSSPAFSYWAPNEGDIWLYGSEMDAPVTVGLNEACGKTFRWRIIGAPSWIRFPSLEGTSAQGLTFAVIEEEALATETSTDGWIWIESLDHPNQAQDISVWVGH